MIYTTKLKTLLKSGARIGAVVVLAFGILAFLELTSKGMAVGGILVLACTFFLTAYDGVQIDTKNRKYRIITVFFWVKSGQWVNLPALKKISVVESSDQVHASDGISNSVSGSKRVYLVKFFPEGSGKSIIAGKYSKLEKAKSFAGKLSSDLSVAVE
jgi:hypothetical protein